MSGELDELTAYLLANMPFYEILSYPDELKLKDNFVHTALWVYPERNSVQCYSRTYKIGKARMVRILDAIAQRQAQQQKAGKE